MKKPLSIQDEIFEGTILVKGFNGVIEIFFSSLAFLTGSQAIVKSIETIFSHELSQDPNDFLINFLIDLISNIGPGTQVFIAVYLGIHGLLNLFFFTIIWKKKISFYPIVIVIMTTLVVYQVIRFSINHSSILLLITIIDVVIIYFVIREYVKKKNLPKR